MKVIYGPLFAIFYFVVINYHDATEAWIRIYLVSLFFSPLVKEAYNYLTSLRGWKNPPLYFLLPNESLSFLAGIQILNKDLVFAYFLNDKINTI